MNTSGRKRFVELLAGFRTVRKSAKALGAVGYALRRRELFEELAIDLVLDVGANTGQFAIELRTFYRGDIISFEPVSAAYRELVRAAGGDPRWRCIQTALGSKRGRKSIHVSNQHLVFSSFLKLNDRGAGLFGPGSMGNDKEVVTIRRLDDVLEEAVPDFPRRRVFLKVDTQGFDVEVLKGLGDKLAHVSVLQSEVSVIPIYEGIPHWTDCISYYEKAGFELAGLFPVSMVSGRVVELDCLMVRRPK